MKILLIFVLSFFVSACSKTQIHHNSRELNVIDEWSIMENIIVEKWNKDKVTDLQSWTFSFDDNNIVFDITYIPTSRGKPMFMDSLRSQWSQLKCFEKSELSKNPHVVMKMKHLSCDNGKRKAYYNIYDEVESIFVSR